MMVIAYDTLLPLAIGDVVREMPAGQSVSLAVWSKGAAKAVTLPVPIEQSGDDPLLEVFAAHPTPYDVVISIHDVSVYCNTLFTI